MAHQQSRRWCGSVARRVFATAGAAAPERHRGEIDERTGRTGRKILDDIHGLRIRFLGHRSLEDHAWRLATKLNWPEVYQAEYIALTQLPAGAVVTLDDKLAAPARAFVKTAFIAGIPQP